MNIKTIAGAALIAAALVALAAPAALAQGAARSWAMGGASTAGSRGLEAALYNPANLAFSPGVTVGLVGVAASLENNSISLDLYNEITGQVLDEADKQRVLDAIDGGGLGLSADVQAAGLGVQAGGLAFSLQGTATGRGNLDRDVFDLVLFGNHLDETVSFDDTWGQGHAYGAATLSFGTVVGETAAGRWAVGASVRYLQGLYEAHVEEARGSLTTSADGVDGEALLSLVTADQGSGFGADLGVSLQVRGGWTLAVACRNALGSIAWSGNAERRLYQVTATALNASTEDIDEAVADTDTTYAIGGYSTRLPREVRLGASRDTGRLTLAADYVQGLDDAGTVTTDPALALGAEWRPWGWLVPRAGVSLGGLHGSSLSGGLGLRLGFWHMDFLVASRGAVTGGGSSKGIAGGMSLQLVF